MSRSSILVLCLVGVGCGSRTPLDLPQQTHGYTVEIVSGDGQVAPVSTVLSERLVARVVDEYGAPANAVIVEWLPPEDGSVFPLRSVTAADGTTEVEVTAPSAGGVLEVIAQLPSTSSPFTINVQPVLASLTPIASLPGASVTVSGAGFVVGETTVSFGATPATVTGVDATSVTAEAPIVADTADVQVNVRGVDAVASLRYGALVDRAPTLLAGLGPATNQCQLRDSHSSRNIAIDAANRIYISVRCNQSNEAFVLVSNDGGASFGAPVLLSSNGGETAIAGGPDGFAVVGFEESGDILASTTNDGGQTWTPASVVVPNRSHPSIAMLGDRVCISGRGGGQLSLAVSPDLGESWLPLVSETFAAAGTGDVVADPESGNVYLIGNANVAPPNTYIRESTDGGLSFGGLVAVTGVNLANADFAAGRGGLLYAVGTNDQMFVITLADPTNNNGVTNENNANGNTTSVHANGAGNIYRVGSNGGDGVFVQALRAGSALDDPITISPTGEFPAIVSIPGGVTFFAWELNGEIFFASRILP